MLLLALFLSKYEFTVLTWTLLLSPGLLWLFSTGILDNFSFLIVLYLQMRFQVNFFISVVNILRKTQTIPSSHTILFVPIVNKDSLFLHVPTNTCYCQFGCAHPHKCEMASHRGYISVSWWLVMLTLHLNIYWPLKSFFRKMPVHFHFKWSYLIDDVKLFLFVVSSFFIVLTLTICTLICLLFYQAVTSYLRNIV